MMVDKDLTVTSTMTMVSRHVTAGRNANAIHIARLTRLKDQTNIARFGKSVHIKILEVETWIVTSVILTVVVAVAVAAIISVTTVSTIHTKVSQSLSKNGYMKCDKSMIQWVSENSLVQDNVMIP